VAGKHSKQTKKQFFDTSYDTPQTPPASQTPYDSAAADASGEFDSIIADLLRSAVEAEHASTIAKPRFDFETELDEVIDNAFKNATEATKARAKAADKGTTGKGAADKGAASAKTAGAKTAETGKSAAAAAGGAGGAKATDKTAADADKPSAGKPAAATGGKKAAHKGAADKAAEATKPAAAVGGKKAAGKKAADADASVLIETDEQGKPAATGADEQNPLAEAGAGSELETHDEIDAPVTSSALVVEPITRRAVWPLLICAIVIFIVVTGGLTYFNRLLITDQADERAVIQQQGNDYLNESIALIQEADSVIVALDKASESRVTEEDIPRLEALLEQVDSVQGSLDSAIEKAQQAKETFLEEEYQELAQHAQDAAGYRKQMLKMSSELTSYDIAAMKSALSLEYAWGLIVEADASMRSAVETVTMGWGTVTESREYNQEAFDKLVLADEALVVASETFPTADFGSLRAYLNIKKESAELALASDDALLEGDYYLASTKNEEFIAKDAEAVGLAANIPTDPMSLVFAAYEEATVQLRGDYKTVRSQAADTDVYLRAYLGVDVQQTNESE
jgi:hypothetical protein